MDGEHGIVRLVQNPHQQGSVNEGKIEKYLDNGFRNLG